MFGLLLAPGIGRAADAPVVAKAPALSAIVAAMQSAGFAADAATVSAGRTVLVSALDLGAEPIKFAVEPFGCDERGDCAGVQFVMASKFGATPALQTLNDWNARQVISKAYLAGDDLVFVRMPVVTRGGVSETSFHTALSIWKAAVHDLLKTLQSSKTDR